MATNNGEDWLKTPGIAHRSVREMQAMGKKERMGKAVILCFPDTPIGQRIKENHARHMNNLRDRFLDMERGKNVEETKRKSTEESPTFGTISSFCDKKRERRDDRRLQGKANDRASHDDIASKQREAESSFHGQTETSIPPLSTERRQNLPMFTGEIELELRDPRLTELLVYSRAEVVSRREDDTGRVLVRARIELQPVVNDT